MAIESTSTAVARLLHELFICNLTDFWWFCVFFVKSQKYNYLKVSLFGL